MRRQTKVGCSFSLLGWVQWSTARSELSWQCIEDICYKGKGQTEDYEWEEVKEDAKADPHI
jgi:hypothetical protein